MFPFQRKFKGLRVRNLTERSLISFTSIAMVGIEKHSFHEVSYLGLGRKFFLLLQLSFQSVNFNDISHEDLRIIFNQQNFFIIKFL
jgi:hypothetical protein